MSNTNSENASNVFLDIGFGGRIRERNITTAKKKQKKNAHTQKKKQRFDSNYKGNVSRTRTYSAKSKRFIYKKTSIFQVNESTNKS